MKLSIVIPTRNRASALETTLAAFCAIIQSSPRKRDVELVCVDNFSRDDTQAVCKRYASRHSFVRYFHHTQERHSAETSAFNAIDFASGEYVWLFGDDDTPVDGCIDTVLNALEEYNPSFALLNLLFDRGDETSEYINSVQPLIYFRNGLDFFKRFGLITAVTTISCICFRKSTFDRSLFDEFAKISEIYSHTFALFANYHRAPVLFVARPVLKYLATHEAVELEKIGGHSRAKGLPTYYAFGHGLARLIRAASRITGVPIETIAAFEEIVIDKTLFRVRPMLLWAFIVRTFIYQHQSDPFNRFRSEHVAELQAIAAQLNNPTARLCWDACVQISSPDSCAHEDDVIQRVTGILNDFEEEYFQSARCQKPVEDFHSIYFQNGVVPINLTLDNSLHGRPLPPLVVVIRVDDENESNRVLAVLKNTQQRLKGFSVKWVLWTCSDPSRWQRASPPAEVLVSDELPMRQLSELGEYVVFLRPGSMLFPNALLFALNLLVSRGADAAVFNTTGDWAHIGISDLLGDLRSPDLVRKMQPEEGRAAYSLLAAAPGESPMIAAAKNLLSGESASVLHISCPLSIDVSFISQPSEALSAAADSISQPGSNAISKLAALNRLTTGGLMSSNAVAPVSAENIGKLYSCFRPNIETAVGALVMENLLLLLAIRRCWENTWKFSESMRTQLVSQLHDLNFILLSETKLGHSSRPPRRVKIEKSRSKRQTRYTEIVQWVNKRPAINRFCERTIRLVSKTRLGRRHLTRLHRHYYHPVV